MYIFDVDDIAIVGKENQNAMVLYQNKSILISSDILAHNDSISKNKAPAEPHISIDAVEEKIDILANEILLAGSGGTGHAPEPIVYGEALVETLRWMIDVLKTHKHPPNAAPIPDFFDAATSRQNDMETYLLNQSVKSR